MKKLKKVSDQELVNELISRGHGFVSSYSGDEIKDSSIFLGIPFEDVLEVTSGDEEVSDEFFDEHFMSVYKSVDWVDVRERAFIYVYDFISLTLRKKYGVLNSYNEKVWEVDVK